MATGGMLVERLGSISAGQWSLVTSAQARGVGVTGQQLARLSALGLLERVRHGIYRVASAPPEEHVDLQAAWLSLSPARSVDQRLTGVPDAVVSHRSAAALHRFGDLDASRREFRVTQRHQTRDKNIRLHRSQDPPAEQDWTLVGGLPVTTAGATIADLAAAGIDGGHLAGVVRDALAGGHVSTVEVQEALAPAAHRYGATPGAGGELLAELLAQAGVDENTVHVTDLLAWRRTRIAAVQYATHLPSVAGGELRDLLAPLLDLVDQTTARHADAAVQALSDVLSARLAPVVKGLSADLLAAARPSLDGVTDAALTPVLEAIDAHVSATRGPLLAPVAADLTALALSRTAGAQDRAARDQEMPAMAKDASGVVGSADVEGEHPGGGGQASTGPSSVGTAR